VNGIAREGTLGYASVIEAKNCHPNKSKAGKSTDYTAGNVHDSNCFMGLLSGNETADYAGRA